MSDKAREQADSRRFWSKTRGSGGCIEWIGAKNRQGYGLFHYMQDGKKRNISAHRWAYIHSIGPIPPGLVLDHLCRNTGCVNLKHLEPVTNRENVLRGIGIPPRNLAKTHCPKGHEYSASNTYLDPRGFRNCIACRTDSQRRYEERKAHERNQR